jgi:hypothetical protein
LTGYPDFFWFNFDEAEATAALVADIVARRIRVTVPPVVWAGG